MSQFIEMFGMESNLKALCEICDIRGGATPNRKVEDYWKDGKFPWFTIEDIYEQGKYIEKTKQHITEEGRKKVFNYPPNTVLICCTASIGECALTKVSMSSNQQFNGLMIKDQKQIHPEYLLYVASTLKDQLMRLAGKTTIHFVSRTKLESIKIPVPSIEQQKKFVAIKQQHDKSEFELKKSIEAIDAVIKSLINN